jgi:molybdopterin converting factor small subunit
VKLFINILGPDVKLKEEVSFELSSASLEEVLGTLRVHHKSKLERFIEDDLSSAEGSAILLNGRNIRSLDRSATKIRDGDELTFTVMVAGG